MFQNAKDKFTISIFDSLLANYRTEELSAGKRLVSVIAGIYMLQKGIRTVGRRTVRGIEEITLGSILLYSAASGLHKKIVKKPIEASDMRKNQIQGNDPRSDVPAFV